MLIKILSLIGFVVSSVGWLCGFVLQGVFSWQVYTIAAHLAALLAVGMTVCLLVSASKRAAVSLSVDIFPSLPNLVRLWVSI